LDADYDAANKITQRVFSSNCDSHLSLTMTAIIPSDGATRRTFLAGTAAVATGGCLKGTAAAGEGGGRAPLTLSLATVPADADPISIRIARYLSLRLKRVGIETTIVPMSREELAREVLLNQNFDLYVGQFPAHDTADFLRLLLHSRFASEPGWGNPFGYANADVDRLLEGQTRQRDSDREGTLRQVQWRVVGDQPFSVVAAPEEIRVARRVGNIDWGDDDRHTIQSYLALEQRSVTGSHGSGRVVPQTSNGTDASRDEQTDALEVVVTDARITENLNPVAVPYRTGGPVIDLLYDSLARRIDGEVTPWLAREWDWDRTEAGLVADVRLREGLTWHDGESLTADDVDFTFRFLEDTALGELDERVPAHRYRARGSLVEDVTALTSRRVRLRFATDVPAVAAQALTVPVVPGHVWKHRTRTSTLTQIAGGDLTTEALTTPNTNPVGSGPLRFESVAEDEHLTLAPFEGHFLCREEVPASLERFRGCFDLDRLTLRVVPSTGAALSLLKQGEADLTGSPLDPRTVDEGARVDDLVVESRQSNELYHVGYNLRKEPLDDPAFRRALAQLVDKKYLVSDVFEGNATPAASPLAADESLAPSLTWEDGDPAVPFVGRTGTGELDVQRARDAFTRAGYEYTENGHLTAEK
jgi:peptide/nickel transport system substrate-binding protein